MKLETGLVLTRDEYVLLLPFQPLPRIKVGTERSLQGPKVAAEFLAKSAICYLLPSQKKSWVDPFIIAFPPADPPTSPLFSTSKTRFITEKAIMGKSKRARENAETDEKPFDWGIEVPAKKRKVDDAATDADNTEVKKTKKEKKDKKDKKDKHKKESRKEKKDKKKDLQDLPMEDAPEEDESEPVAEVKEAKSKKELKKEKKAKKGTEEINGEEQINSQEEKSAAEKKDKKKDKKSKKETKDKSGDPAEPTSNGDSKATEANGDESSSSAIDLPPSSSDQKQDRHIVFVGNLPFTATAASISAHFASLSPIAVRCLKDKNSDKPCRGIAFVEFGKVWHMRTCLDKFHHSMFEDGVSPGRRINVELT